MDFMLNRKGITPIIAVILLLMMTIAIAGLAYTWLQRTQTTIQTSTENTTSTLLSGLKVNLKVDGYNITCTQTNGKHIRIYGRNAGTEQAKNLQLYVDDALVSGASNASLNSGVSTTWLLTNQSSGSGGSQACADWINRTRTIKLSSDEATAEKSFTFLC